MKCERCGGSGSNNETNPRLREPCPDCNGTGNQPESHKTIGIVGSGMSSSVRKDLVDRLLKNEPNVYVAGGKSKTPDPPEESQDERISSDNIFAKLKEVMPEISTHGPFKLELCDAEEVENILFDLCSQIISRDAEVEKAERVNLGLHREITYLNERIKEILSALDTTIEERDEYAKEIDELKCCGNCGAFAYHVMSNEEICKEGNIPRRYLSGRKVCDNWKRRSE